MNNNLSEEAVSQEMCRRAEQETEDVKVGNNPAELLIARLKKLKESDETVGRLIEANLAAAVTGIKLEQMLCAEISTGKVAELITFLLDGQCEIAELYRKHIEIESLKSVYGEK